MDGFLILIEASCACAIAALTASKAELWYEDNRQSQRRQQALKQVLNKSEGELCTRSLRLSDRQFEMELLLMHLSSNATLLMQALATEVKCGEKAGATTTESPLWFGQWQEARRAVEQAQVVYTEAQDAYHEFLRSLPPPMRAKAVERGALAMAASPA
jgi:hypothetical protein